MQHNQKEVDPDLVDFLGEDRTQKLASTPQSPIHHKEGDVLTHLMMMLDVWKSWGPSLQFDSEEKDLIQKAIYLHDYSKPECTINENGKISSPHHSTRGEKHVRFFLYQKNYPAVKRERLCKLVRYHMYPTRIFSGKEEPELLLTQLALQLKMPCKYLFALAYCDIKGRICRDQEELLTQVQLFAELSKEMNCYDQLFPIEQHFQDELRKNLREELKHYICNRSYNMNLGWKYRSPRSFPEFEGEFIMMSGVPGAGKTTYIQKESSRKEGSKIVSLDDLRQDFDKKYPDQKLDSLYNIAKEQLRSYFRDKVPTVFLDATSLSKEMRSYWLKIAHNYNYRTHIVVLERPYQALLDQNTTRVEKVPPQVLVKMMKKFEFPSPQEAHQITWKHFKN